MKSSFDLTKCPQYIQVIGKAMKTYGMVVTDGDGVPAFSLTFERDFAYPYDASPWYYLGIQQRSLTDDCAITAEDFEVVRPPDYPKVITYEGNCALNPFSMDTCTFNFTTGHSTKHKHGGDDKTEEPDNTGKPDSTDGEAKTGPPLMTTTPKESGDGLSGGDIAGIVIGSVFGTLLVVVILAAVVGLVAFFVVRRIRSRKVAVVGSAQYSLMQEEGQAQ